MQKFAIIVAGGAGVRMGGPVPKQFLTLANQPVLMHTLQRFVNAVPGVNIYLVLPAAHFDTWAELVKQYNFKLKYNLIKGGGERFYSVKNALEAIDAGNGIVAVHDGVRPLASGNLIKNAFTAAEEHDAVIPVTHLADSLRELSNYGSVAVDRSKFRMVQTPQTFKLNLLKSAYFKPYIPAYTDDASVMEAAGHKVHLIEGERFNIKITNPEDLKIAETLM